MTARKLSRSLVASALGAALALGGGSVQAASLLSLFVPGNNVLSDEDREYLIDRVRNVDSAGNPIVGPTTGQIDVGDSFRGFGVVNTLNSANANVGGATGNDEWGFVFQQLVVAKSCVGATCTFVFAPDPAFEADLGGGQIVTGWAPGTGAMVASFQSSTINATLDYDDTPVFGTGGTGVAPPGDSDTSLANGPIDDGTAAPRTVPPKSTDVSVGPYASEEAFGGTTYDDTMLGVLPTPVLGTPDDPTTPTPETVTLLPPNLVWVLGFDPASLPVEFFNATFLGDSVLTAFTVGSGTQLGAASFGLKVLTTGIFPQVQALPQTLGCVNPLVGIVVGIDICGSAQIRGVGNLDTAFEVSTNFNADANIALAPEPGTVALTAIGLLVLGVSARRRRSGVQG